MTRVPTKPEFKCFECLACNFVVIESANWTDEKAQKLELAVA
jgi:hypothetical protein